MFHIRESCEISTPLSLRASFPSPGKDGHAKMSEMAQYIKHKGATMQHRLFGQTLAAFNPQTHAACDWSKLLNDLHLTEEAALLAVAANDTLGAKLRVFVRRVHRVRYIPEDVLMLLNLNKESGAGSLHVRNLGAGEDDAE